MLGYVIAGMIGFGVAAGELISRYKDAPKLALATKPAWLYLGLNVLTALVALRLVRLFDLHFGVSLDGEPLHYFQTAIAGLGSMTLMRSAVFVARIGNQDIPIGAGAVLHETLRAADRSIDRNRASERMESISATMEGITYSTAKTELPPLCMGLMQNLTATEQKELMQLVADIESKSVSESTKTQLLGLILAGFVGHAVVERAVGAVRQPTKAGSDVEYLKPLISSLNFKKHVKELVEKCLVQAPDTELAKRGDIAREVNSLRAKVDMTDEDQMLQIALLLHRMFGRQILTAAVNLIPTGVSA